MTRREIDEQSSYPERVRATRALGASLEEVFRSVEPGEVAFIRPEDEKILHEGEPEPTLSLERFAYTPMGTFGQLIMREFTCYTVERPWFNNAPRVSCIPVGLYKLAKSRYHRGGYNTLQLYDVPGRSLIKIHRGNTMEDVLGCVAIGKALGWVHDKWAVIDSANCFQEWWALMVDRIEAEAYTQEEWQGEIQITFSSPTGKVPEPMLPQPMLLGGAAFPQGD